MQKATPIDPKISRVEDSKIDPAAKERKDIRIFGGSFVIILGIIAALGFWRESWVCWLWIPAVVIGIPALAFPLVMKPVYKAWMMMAAALGFVMSRIMFSVFYYIAITPMALVMKLIRRDHLRLKFHSDEKSNWTEVPESANDPKHFEHLF